MNPIWGIAAAIAISVATIGTGIGQGIAAGKAFDAISRQPEKTNDIRTLLIMSLGFIEALAIYALLISFLILSRAA